MNRDVWEIGTPYTGHPIGSAETVEVFSSDATDTALGDGARVVSIFGLDANFDMQGELLTLDGVSAVESAGLWQRVFGVFVDEAGVSGSNAGTLTVRHATTTVNVFAVVLPLFGASQSGAYTVPAGHRAIVVSWGLAMGRLTGTTAGSANVSLQSRKADGSPSGWTTVHSHALSTGSHAKEEFTIPPVFPEKTDIKARVLVISGNDTSITMSMDILLLEEDTFPEFPITLPAGPFGGIQAKNHPH